MLSKFSSWITTNLNLLEAVQQKWAVMQLNQKGQYKNAESIDNLKFLYNFPWAGKKNPFHSKKQNYRDLENPNTNKFICTDYVVHDLLCQTLTTFHLSSNSKHWGLHFHCNFRFFFPQLYLFVFPKLSKAVGYIVDLPCKEFPANIKPFCLELLAKGCNVNKKKLKWQECKVLSYSHRLCTSQGICARWPILKIQSLKYQLECKCLPRNVQNRAPCWFCDGSWMPVSETITPTGHLKALMAYGWKLLSMCTCRRRSLSSTSWSSTGLQWSRLAVSRGWNCSSKKVQHIGQTLEYLPSNVEVLKVHRF